MPKSMKNSEMIASEFSIVVPSGGKGRDYAEVKDDSRLLLPNSRVIPWCLFSMNLYTVCKCFVNTFLRIQYLTIKKKNPARLDAEPLLKQAQMERPRVLDHGGFPQFPL